MVYLALFSKMFTEQNFELPEPLLFNESQCKADSTATLVNFPAQSLL